MNIQLFLIGLATAFFWKLLRTNSVPDKEETPDYLVLLTSILEPGEMPFVGTREIVTYIDEAGTWKVHRRFEVLRKKASGKKGTTLTVVRSS